VYRNAAFAAKRFMASDAGGRLPRLVKKNHNPMPNNCMRYGASVFLPLAAALAFDLL
jgi:hypothetical protein